MIVFKIRQTSGDEFSIVIAEAEGGGKLISILEESKQVVAYKALDSNGNLLIPEYFHYNKNTVRKMTQKALWLFDRT